MGAEKYRTKNVRNYEFGGVVVFGRFLVVWGVRFCVGVGVVGWRGASWRSKECGQNGG